VSTQLRSFGVLVEDENYQKEDDFTFEGLVLKSITFVTSFVKISQVIIYRCHCLPLDTIQPCEHDKLWKPACLSKFPSWIQLQHSKHNVLKPLVAINQVCKRNRIVDSFWNCFMNMLEYFWPNSLPTITGAGHQWTIITNKGGTFRVGLASEIHWLQPMLVLTVHCWPTPISVVGL
jgi:hypothetical protein